MKKASKLIFIFNQFAISPDMPGGTRHYDFGKELAKRGYEVYIFASDYSYQKLEYLKLKNNEEYVIENINGVNFVWVKTPAYKKNNYKRIINQIAFSINAIKIASNIKLKPDFIIGSSPTLFTAFMSYKYTKCIGAKYIAEIRDLWPESLYCLNKRLKYHPYTLLLKIISAYLYKKSKKIIVFTKGNKEYISKKSKAKIEYIPNGVKKDMFEEFDKRNIIRKKYGFKDFTFVYTGAIGVANSIDTIVKACERIRDEDINVKIFGSGPLKDKLKAEIKKRDLKNIKILSPVEKSEIPSILNASDGAIITLKDIPLFRFGVSPNKIFEYMYAGLPVLCAIEGEMGDMIRDADCGYVVKPDNPDDLAEKMIKLYSLPKQERVKKGQNGKRYIEKYFLREELVEKLKDFLDL